MWYTGSRLGYSPLNHEEKPIHTNYYAEILPELDRHNHPKRWGLTNSLYNKGSSFERWKTHLMLLTSFYTQDWNPDLHASKVWALAEGLVYPSMNHPNSKKKQIRYAKRETSHHNREDILKTYTSRAGCLEQFVSIKCVLKERFTIKKRGSHLCSL